MGSHFLLPSAYTLSQVGKGSASTCLYLYEQMQHAARKKQNAEDETERMFSAIHAIDEETKIYEAMTEMQDKSLLEKTVGSCAPAA